MKLFKLKRKNIILVSLLAIAGFLGISSVAVNQTTRDTPVAEKAEAVVSETSFRVYVTINVNYIINPTIRTSWTSDTWSSMGTSISASTNYPASSSLGTYVYDVPLSSGTQTWLGLHCYDNDDGGKTVYIPKNSEQSKDDTTNSLYGVTFTPGHIYKVTVKGWSGESSSGYWHKCFDWDITDYGVFVHYDYNGGSGGEGTSKNYEKQSSSTFKSEIAATKNNFTFKNWSKSSGGTVNANTNLTIGTSPITLTAQWQCTVSFDVQGHGTQPDNQIVQIGGKATDPGSLTDGNYTFGGWFKEAACTTAWNFSSDTVSTNTTIYAKWTYQRTIYYISDVTRGDDDTGNYIYSWTGGIKSFGEFPGVTVSSSRAVSVVMNFRGTYRKIYCITIYDDHFKLSNYNQSVQANDMPTYNNYAYRWDGDNVTMDEDEGAALRVIDLIEQARNAVPAAGNIKQWSICGIDSTTAGSLVGAYDGLTETQKGYVDASFTYTYTADGSSSENVYFNNIINQLRSRVSGTRSGASLYTPFNLMGGENNFSTVIIIISSSVALLSVTALSILVIRKRKSKED